MIPLPHALEQAKKKAIRRLTLFELERNKIAQELEKAKTKAAGIVDGTAGVQPANVYPVHVTVGTASAVP